MVEFFPNRNLALHALERVATTAKALHESAELANNIYGADLARILVYASPDLSIRTLTKDLAHKVLVDSLSPVTVSLTLRSVEISTTSRPLLGEEYCALDERIGGKGGNRLEEGGDTESATTRRSDKGPRDFPSKLLCDSALEIVCLSGGGKGGGSAAVEQTRAEGGEMSDDTISEACTEFANASAFCPD